MAIDNITLPIGNKHNVFRNMDRQQTLMECTFPLTSAKI